MYEVPDSRDFPVSLIPGIRLGGEKTISFRGHMLTQIHWTGMSHVTMNPSYEL